MLSQTINAPWIDISEDGILIEGDITNLILDLIKSLTEEQGLKNIIQNDEN